MPTRNRECESGEVSIVMFMKGDSVLPTDRGAAGGTAGHQNSFGEVAPRSKNGSLFVR